MSAAHQQTPARPVPYQPSLEQAEDNETAVDTQICENLRHISETTLKNAGSPLRSVHAKSHGLLIGKLSVPGDLPTTLAQGLFAKPGTYDVIIRLSTTPGDVLRDAISTPRGMAIKILDVEGERAAGSDADTTQDFVLVNGPAFNAPNAAGFLQSLKLLAPTTDDMEPAKQIFSAVARGAEAVIEAVGGESGTLKSLGGHPETDMLGDSYYSQTPILYGDYIAKIGVFPTAPGLLARTGADVKNNGEPNFLRNLVVDYFLQNAGSWDLRVQLCTNLETMPIEDASVVWPETESPYLTVATINVPAQDPWTIDKIAAIDEGLSFTPWHALAAHRPLGSVNRARKSAYEMSAKFRAENQHKAIIEPHKLSDLTGGDDIGAPAAYAPRT
jgi:hypothetical protein